MSPLRFCHILTSNGNDDHANMAYVSIAFLRAIYPTGRLSLLLDEISLPAVRNAKHPILNIVDEVLEVNTGLSSPVERNRCTKMLMRKTLRGDFVYLDNDTMPISRFDDLWKSDHPLAAALDWNPEKRERPIQKWVLERFAGMNWTVPSLYYNSGVLLLRDRPEVHRFTEAWHEKWNAFRQKYGHYDQPAMNSALHDTKVEIQTLDSSYNAMVVIDTKVIRNAKILHLFTSMSGVMETTIMSQCIDEVRAHGFLSKETIGSILKHRYPWADQDSVRRQWYSGHRFKAAKLAVKRLLKGRRKTSAS